MADLQDFGFFHGQWQVRHRRLVGRLVGATAWQEYGGACRCWPLMGGASNVDDNPVDLPGEACRAVVMWSFDEPRGL